MANKSFFCATEVWTPTADRQHLDLTAGLYNDMPYFEAISRGMRFARDEGLPGKAWASGHPIILKNLSNSYFRRGDAAMTDGLSGAVALPIFGADDLTAVIVLFFGDNRYQRGAVELWNAPQGSGEMTMVDGYFGRAEQFGTASRDTAFACGAGLPGKVWESELPVIVADLAADDDFMRRESAERFTMSRAVGIPCSGADPGNWVLTMLSVRNSPIARRFECWVPDELAGTFELADGYCETSGTLEDSYAGLAVPLATGLFAEVRKTGIPAISADVATIDDPVARVASAAGMVTMVAVPIFARGQFKAVLAWYL